MFLFWNWISWDTCYDRDCFHSGGFLTSFSIPRHRKPSSGFGILYSVLTFCGCGMVILIYIYLLLGVLTLMFIIFHNPLIFIVASFFYIVIRGTIKYYTITSIISNLVDIYNLFNDAKRLIASIKVIWYYLKWLSGILMVSVSTLTPFTGEFLTISGNIHLIHILMLVISFYILYKVLEQKLYINNPR